MNSFRHEEDDKNYKLTTITFIRQRHLSHFRVGNVLVRRKKQHNLSFLIFDWNDVQEAPEWSSCGQQMVLLKWTSERVINKSLTSVSRVAWLISNEMMH